MVLSHVNTESAEVQQTSAIEIKTNHDNNLKMSPNDTSGDVIVRQFQPSDQERCIELFRAGLTSYKESPMDKLNSWFVEVKLKEDMKDIHAHYIHNKKQSNFWVAELNGVVIGCVGAVPDEHLEGSLELVRMSVDSTIHRRGVGSLLIQQLEKFAKSEGFSKVSLTTLVWMHRACSFYEGSGYTRRESFKWDTPIGVAAHIQPFVKEFV